jgi:hypothetical protein
MASLKTYIDSPLFTDGVELSATEMNILRNNADAIKLASIRSVHVHDISRILQVQNNGWVGRYGFQYRTGLTTARFIIWTKQISGEGDHDIVIYFNGVEVYRYNAAVTGLNVGGFTTVDLAINTRGYTNYQIITVEIKAEPQSVGADATKGEQYVFDAYTFPHTSIAAGSWPGKPTFGAINATRLNQISNGLDYLANRVSNVPYPLSMNIVNFMGTNNPKYPKFRYFRVRFANQNKRFKTGVYYICQQTQAYIRLTIGSQHWDYGPYTKDQKVAIGIDVDGIAAGLAYDTDYFGSLEEYVTTPGSNADGHGGFIFSRVWNDALHTFANSYSLAATPVTNAILESITYATTKSRLQAIADIIDTANTTITAQTSVFDRGYMFRGRYGIKPDQDDYWATTFIPGKYREGDLLWVKGQDLKISYGKYTIQPKTDDKINDIWEYKFQFEETLLSNDGVQQSYFYLDQFENLHPGMFYYVTGKQIDYVAEHLR